MKLFPQDNDVVIYETGFEDDILDRTAISKQLSDLVERIENPVVIALDDKWGSGKTYFLKRWVTAHHKENKGDAVTVYFDAFESDYLSDPLVSIITAVSDRIPKGQESTLIKWKAVATKLAKPTFGVALSLATFGAKKYVDEIGDVLADAISSEVKGATQDLWDFEKERKDSVRLFKELLSELTEEKSKPIVIIIDELDRCRPDYALSVLEVIKHFFAVPRVHFILGINGKALENSVKARYGADIDAEGYLQKFINLSFSLPRALGARGDDKIIARYTRHLIAEMQLPEGISKRCMALMIHVAEANHVSLRDVGKILSKIPLLPEGVLKGNYLIGWIDILCTLLVSSVVNPTLHKKLITADASTLEIRQFIGATNAKTMVRSGSGESQEYNHDLALWLAEIIFTCGSADLSSEEHLPPWKNEIGQNFDKFGSHRNPKGIPSQIQKDWVEVFRL